MDKRDKNISKEDRAVIDRLIDIFIGNEGVVPAACCSEFGANAASKLELALIQLSSLVDAVDGAAGALLGPSASKKARIDENATSGVESGGFFCFRFSTILQV